MPAHRRSKHSRFALTAAGLLLGCSTTEPEVDADIGGLLVNGGFELPLGSEGWITSVQATSRFHTFAVDSTTARTGRRSATIRIDANHPSSVIFYNWFQSIAAGFEAGRSYQLEAWGMTSDVTEGHRVYVEVRFFNVNNRQMGREWASVPAPPPSLGPRLDWQRVTVSFVVPEGTAVIDVRAGNTAPFNAGATVWFDDVSIVPVGGP
jgi:hypothetical protein